MVRVNTVRRVRMGVYGVCVDACVCTCVCVCVCVCVCAVRPCVCASHLSNF